jgi:hypothetical protein
MGEGSRVPPSEHSPDATDRPTDTALAVPPARGESSMPEVVTAPPAQGGPAESSSALPRRVRGTNGARPPAQVERPALPESFLERFRAAAAASEARDAAAEREVAVGGEPVEDRRKEVNQTSTSKPSDESSSLPVRARGKNGARKPPAQLRPASPLGKSARGEAAREEITQPIPVVSDSPAAESSGGGSSSTAAAPPDQQEAGRRRGVPATEAASEAPAAVVNASPVPQTRQVSPKPTAERRQSSRNGPKATGKNRTGRAYRVVGLLILVAALAVGAGSFVALHHSGHSGRSSLLPSAPIPLAIRNSAGAWVASQVAASDIVACDPVMCRALQAHGMSATRLRVQWPGSDDLSGCAVIVATPVLRARFGGRLDSWYAPGLIARFGSGDKQIAIRVVASHGAAGYRSHLANDLTARKASGVTFATGPASPQLSSVVKKQLAAGQVDSRLIILLADLEGKHPVRVTAFGDASPGVTETIAPLRAADLAITSSASKRSLLAALAFEAKRYPQYRPTHVDPVRLPTGQPALQVEFSAPSPLGLFGY